VCFLHHLSFGFAQDRWFLFTLFSGKLEFLVDCMLAAPATKFLEFNLALHFFLVLARVVIHPLADRAAQTN